MNERATSYFRKQLPEVQMAVSALAKLLKTIGIPPSRELSNTLRVLAEIIDLNLEGRASDNLTSPMMHE